MRTGTSRPAVLSLLGTQKAAHTERHHHHQQVRLRTSVGTIVGVRLLLAVHGAALSKSLLLSVKQRTS